MSRAPAYKQVADDLRKKIATGTLPIDSAIPSMSQLRGMYGVSSTVVRDALGELRREGLIEGQQGKANFVRKLPNTPEPLSGEAQDIRERLDDLTKIVRRLDERMSRLEEGAAQESPAQQAATPSADR